jgi:ribose transport system substrate-binding protein
VRRWLGALALGVLVVAVGGCRRGREGKRARPLIGVTLLTQTQDFYKELEAGLRQEAAAQGLDVAVTACEMDPARQASQIEDFVAQHVAAIVAAPCDSAAIGTNLAVAERAGIPVFTADIAARSGKIVSHVASDNVQGGRLAARALAKALGGKGEVVIIDHPTVASVQDRVHGFEQELANDPDMKIVARPSSDGQRAKAMSVMEDMLQAYPGLKGVFGINDDSALGAVAVLQAAGRKDIAVVGYDATPAARQAIQSGDILKADVIQHPGEIGRTVIQEVARYLKGETVPKLVSVKVGLVDRESLAHP